MGVLKGRKGSVVVAEENWAMAEEEVLEEAEEAATNLAFTLHLDKPLSCQVLLKSPQFFLIFNFFGFSPPLWLMLLWGNCICKTKTHRFVDDFFDFWGPIFRTRINLEDVSQWEIDAWFRGLMWT